MFFDIMNSAVYLPCEDFILEVDAMNIKRKPWIGRFFSGLIILSLAIFLITCQATPVPERLPSRTSELHSPTTLASTTTEFLPLSTLPSSTTFPSTTVWLLSPTPDFSRLNEPALPANPTQFEVGRHLYWLNCAACHGDHGQGLTDEWRSLYVEDGNCWARGCHAGHNGDKGFPIPRTVPAIISSSGDLPPFATAEQLFEFLRTTHPPQNPGFMPDSDYWALTGYLLAENNRLPPGQVLGLEK